MIRWRIVNILWRGVGFKADDDFWMNRKQSAKIFCCSAAQSEAAFGECGKVHVAPEFTWVSDLKNTLGFAFPTNRHTFNSNFFSVLLNSKVYNSHLWGALCLKWSFRHNWCFLAKLIKTFCERNLEKSLILYITVMVKWKIFRVNAGIKPLQCIRAEDSHVHKRTSETFSKIPYFLDH